MEYNLKNAKGDKPVNPISISAQRLNDDFKKSITDGSFIYGVDEIIKITITNNNTESIIFNFSLLDPTGREFKDESCIEYDKSSNILLPNSSIDIIWDLKKCSQGITAGDWELRSFLTSDGKLTDLFTSYQITLVDNIEYYFPDYVKPTNPLESLDFETILVTSKQGGFIASYKITGGILDGSEISRNLGITRNHGTVLLSVDLRMPESGNLILRMPEKILGSQAQYYFGTVEAYGPYGTHRTELEIIQEDKEPDYRAFAVLLPEKTFKIGMEFQSSFGTKEYNKEDYDVILPPIKQIQNDIVPESVICKDGLRLVFKYGDNSPACVKLRTVEKLSERGWAVLHER